MRSRTLLVHDFSMMLSLEMGTGRLEKVIVTPQGSKNCFMSLRNSCGTVSPDTSSLKPCTFAKRSLAAASSNASKSGRRKRIADLSESVVTGEVRFLVSTVIAAASRNATALKREGCCENRSTIIEQQDPTVRMQRRGDASCCTSA